MPTVEEWQHKLWKSLTSDRTVMLGLVDVVEGYPRPMTAQLEGEHGPIWFFGAKDHALVKLLGPESRAIATFGSKGHDLFATIHGRLSISNDRAMIDKLWNRFVAAWYEHGKDDPQLTLLRFDVEHAEVWDDASSTVAGVKMLLGLDPKKGLSQESDRHPAVLNSVRPRLQALKPCPLTRRLDESIRCEPGVPARGGSSNSHRDPTGGAMKFSEFRVGQVMEFGSYTLTEAEIIEFASRYDPQLFHTDPAAASASQWRGIIASGFHTCSVAMRLIVDNVLAGSESSGSPGLSAVRWLKPVRPGDTLGMRVEVQEVKVSQSGGTGIVVWQWQLKNQRAEQVLDLVGTSLFALRKA